MAEEYKEKWKECLDIIRDNIGTARFDTWFSRVEAIKFVDNRLTLLIPSHFYYEKIEDHFLNLLSYVLRRVYGSDIKLEYEIGLIAGDEQSHVTVQSPVQSAAVGKRNKTASQTAAENPVAPKSNQKSPAPFDSQLNSTLNFENYCLGDSNRLPYTIADFIANNPNNPKFNPFFLYGSVGVGKTHLIQAIGIRIKERNPKARVLFTTARLFQNLYAHAAMQKTIPSFINWFQQIDVLLLDDLQELSGKIRTTDDALFPIFNHLHQNNKQLIFTCDRPPMELDGIADRLIDRFMWGITEQLPKPDLALRKKILSFKASKNGLNLPKDVIDFVSECATSSVRELEGIVNAILNRSITLNCPITIDLARDVMRNTVRQDDQPNSKINFEMIVEATAEYYHIDSEAIFSKSRVRDVADARQIIMYLCHKLTKLSSSAIGQKLNRRHATVLHGITAVEDRKAYAKEISIAIDTIESSLK
ncbi:MAG: chromosomal replication initiator protein DnaA [Bacteroides sp.]|nr:chromosomal replication initiator protein DnaA [Bacteroides sp.]